MTDTGRVRISLVTGELEVEGSDAFIARYEDDIRSLLARLKDEVVSGRAGPVANGHGGSRPAQVAVIEGAFGEVLHALPKSATGSDQILVAGFFVARSTADLTFSTNEANRLLIEQGIKLSNPSQSLKNNLVAKRVFKVGSRFRISQTGEQHVRSLIGQRA